MTQIDQTPPAPAAPRQNPRELVRADVLRIMPEIITALPKHMMADRFARIALTTINTRPDLLSVAVGSPEGRTSLQETCMKAAQDGLVLDGREAAIVVRRLKKRDNTYVDVFTYMPMMAGLLKKVRNSGQVVSIECHVVYANDEFSYELGDDAHLKHRPTLDADRGEMQYAYMTALLKDGSRVREVMRKADIDKRKAKSTSRDAKGNMKGPWLEWEDEMWRKTVLRSGVKWLPASTDKETGQNIIDIASRDDEMYDLVDAETGEVTRSNTPKPRAPKERKAGAILDGAATKVAEETQTDERQQEEVGDDDGREPGDLV